MGKASEPDTKMISSQIDKSIWVAFDRMAAARLETKRSHMERAFLLYVGPEYFELQEDWERLAEKYNIEK